MSAEPAVVNHSIEAGLQAVRARIEAAARAVGRAPADVTLVAVSKAQPEERVRAALAAGQRVFGENYLQEAKARWPALRALYPDLQLHMIGPVQTNKARDVVALFDVIETVDRPKLAQVLAHEMARQGRRPACFVQVNTGEEAQKAGVWPGAADGFVRLCRDELGLPVGRPDGDPAGGRGAGAAFRPAGQDRGPQRPGQAQHGHERRFRESRSSSGRPTSGSAARSSASGNAKPGAAGL